MKKAKQRIAIVSGTRTPFARQGSELSGLNAQMLGSRVVSALLHQSNLTPSCVDQLVFGQVIQTPTLPNIAREIVLTTDLPPTTDAFSVTRACATSFQAIASVFDQILLERIEVGIAGGADSASCLPFMLSPKLTQALLKFRQAKAFKQKLSVLARLKARDLLPTPPAIAEYSTGLSMGQTAEQMAKRYQISREEQDDFAHQSHIRAANSWQQGELDAQVTPLFTSSKNRALHKDNLVRFNSKRESYRRLSPVFDKQLGTVTAGNSSALTDGAAALLLMSESKAKKLGIEPLGYIVDYVFTAERVEEDMLLGPAFAIPKLLERTGKTFSDISLFDMHEAFAAQVLANLKVLEDETFCSRVGLIHPLGHFDRERLNITGGSLAYGHPFAATGARMVLQMLHNLTRHGGGLGVVSACAAGGLGAAMLVEGQS